MGSSERRTYSAQKKAAAIAALLVGGRVCVVAREHGIPENTIKTWRRRLRTGELKPEKKRAGVGVSLGPLLYEYLEALITSLISQSQELVSSDRFREMDAGETAIFYGTLLDQTMRMLELLRPLLRDPGEGRS